MPIERQRLRRLLLDLGFVAIESDHEMFNLRLGKALLHTKLSRGRQYRSIDEPLVAEIARQLHITRAFLYQLVWGEKGRDDYYGELRRQGLID